MIVGMDFGTTNSGMAVYDGRTVHILPLDPASSNPRVLRTALYITNGQAVHIGRQAVDTYYDQNIGRVVKTRKVWIGEIEVYADDLYYVTDAYAWVDISEPGRLLLSIKSRLREEDHPGAVIGQFYYSLEDLIALYLTVTRVRAQQLLGQPIREVVLGRPVHFSLDPARDRLAQGRLLQAAFRAGYEKVYLQPEPVAAAFSYETTLTRPQNTLVFDFGGGTLDITVMRLGDARGRQVLATGGVPIAGDVFDRKLTRAKLPSHFGEGSYYGERHKAKKTPRWIYDAFADWQTIIELQSQENRRVLQEIAQAAQRRHQIEALISLVTSNYGLKMFDQVEQAKRELSTRRGAEIRLDGPDFKVREFVTRSEFERIIQPEYMAIEVELARTLAASGLHKDEIDAVVRTGGSAQVPLFYELLCREFGAAKVQTVDVFSSVTAGLGILAHRIAQGEVDTRGYTPDDVSPPPQARGSQPRIGRANLVLLQKRIRIDEGEIEQAVAPDELILVGLGQERALMSAPVSLAGLQSATSLALAEIGFSAPFRQLLLARPEEVLLLITSHYRFLLVTARQLLDLQKMDLQLSDLHPLAEEEALCSLCSWDLARNQERLLLTTSLGYARAYPLPVMRASVEAPIPLKLDNPLPGLPVAAWGVQEDESFVLVTGEGRGVRVAVDALPLTGLQVVNCGKEDRVTAAQPVLEETELLLLTVDGYGRRLVAAMVPEPPHANWNGRSLIARRSRLAGVASPGAHVVTDRRLIASPPVLHLPLAASTRSYPVVRLQPGERVQALIPSTLPPH